MAVISLSAPRWLNVYSTATSTAIGSVTATMNGTDSTKTSKMTTAGRPLPTRLANCLAIWLSSIRDVSAASANTSGATCRRSR